MNVIRISFPPKSIPQTHRHTHTHTIINGTCIVDFIKAWSMWVAVSIDDAILQFFYWMRMAKQELVQLKILNEGVKKRKCMHWITEKLFWWIIAFNQIKLLILRQSRSLNATTFIWNKIKSHKVLLSQSCFRFIDPKRSAVIPFAFWLRLRFGRLCDWRICVPFFSKSSNSNTNVYTCARPRERKTKHWFL